MKFRVSATIASYFLFTLLCLTLFTSASNKKDTTNTLMVFNNNILGIIINQFLTIQDILIVRKTCKVFGNLLKQNDEGIVIFCNYADAQKVVTVNLYWINLEYFLNESYHNALREMEIFTIKDDQYAVLTHARPQKIISWFKKNVTNNRKRKRGKKKGSTFEPLIKVYTKFEYTRRLDLLHAVEFTKGGIVRDNGGNEKCGCKIPKSLLPKLTKIKTIASTTSAFAALLSNGDVFAWGKKELGGFIPGETQFLKNIKMIFSTKFAFAALSNDGNVIAWGLSHAGGRIPDDVQSKLKKVKMIYSNDFSFVALLENGASVSWGDHFIDRGIIHVDPQNASMIFSTSNAFAALLSDGSVRAWGFSMRGGLIPSEVQFKLKKVKMIFSNERKFIALLQNGDCVSWEDPAQPKNIPHPIQLRLKNVKQIVLKTELTSYGNRLETFIAVCENGQTIEWF